MLDTLATDAELTMEQLQKDYGLLVGAEQSASEVLRIGKAEREYIVAMMRRGDDCCPNHALSCPPSML